MIYRRCEINQRLAVVYHPQTVAVYHQHAVLYLIKPQGIQPTADDIRLAVMIYTLTRDDIPSLRLG